MEFSYPSLNRPGISYKFAYAGQNGRHFVWSYITEHESSDGVQHGPDLSVSRNDFADICASLASELLRPAADQQEKRKEVADAWPHVTFPPEKIAFARKIKHNPDKLQWYCLRDCKISGAESKQYDKRWKRIESCHDGSLASVYTILMAEWGYHSDELIACWALYRACKEQGDRPDAETFFGFQKSPPSIFRPESDAFAMLHRIVSATWEIECALRSLSCYNHNISNMQKEQ